MTIYGLLTCIILIYSKFGEHLATSCDVYRGHISDV